MTKSIFDGAEIGIPCPACGHKNQKTAGGLRSQNKITCGGCGRDIEIVDKGFRAGLDQADKAIADLKRKLGRAFK